MNLANLQGSESYLNILALLTISGIIGIFIVPRIFSKHLPPGVRLDSEGYAVDAQTGETIFGLKKKKRSRRNKKRRKLS